MDADELEEIAFHRQHGRPETTRGPYYHKTWWESYKGAVKGILGGLAIGGMVGATAGGGVLAVIALAVPEGIAAVGTVGAGAIMAATTGFGMYEGKKKFEQVGITTGAVAASQEISEVRMKEYVRERFTGLTNEIRELKAVVAGKKDSQDMQTEAAAPDTQPIFDESDFRATHQTSDDPSDDHKLIYWNVAAIGAAVGAVTAMIAGIAVPALPEGVAHFLGGSLTSQLPAGAATTVTIASGAALGGSFGISRDIFRKIFDVTDCWFMGVADGSCSNEQIAEAKGRAFTPLEEHQTKPESHKAQSQMQPETPIAQRSTTLMHRDQQTPTPEVRHASISGPQSTFFQDRISEQDAKAALLGLDHTSARAH